MTFNLRDLQHFIAVAEMASFTQAAESRALSQPALSRAIRNLEDRLDTRLFDREGREVALTPVGARLLPIAKRLIREAELGLEDVQAFVKGARGKIVVAALPSVAATILPHALAAFQAIWPDVDIQIVDDLAEGVIDAVQDGRADIGLTIRPSLPSKLHFETLMQDPFCSVRRRCGGDIVEDDVWSDLAGTPFIAMTHGSSVREATDRAFAQAGVTPKPLFECRHLATVGALVSQGLGKTALPALALRHLRRDNLDWCPLQSPTVMREIGLVVRTDRISAHSGHLAPFLVSAAMTMEAPTRRTTNSTIG